VRPKPPSIDWRPNSSCFHTIEFGIRIDHNRSQKRNARMTVVFVCLKTGQCWRGVDTAAAGGDISGAVRLYSPAIIPLARHFLICPCPGDGWCSEERAGRARIRRGGGASAALPGGPVVQSRAGDAVFHSIPACLLQFIRIRPYLRAAIFVQRCAFVNSTNIGANDASS
jgi:hypothetical protein